MWSALMNGSGLHGGGGAGGGYVPSQGWEFVPCSRMAKADRGRGKSRSPLRRVSSPPTVFTQIYEPQFGASPGGGEGGAGIQTDILRGQMWPSPEPQQQQQTRLKKKCEDLKKRHEQDKEEWMREKELLLREVADIQGGENRRILLDLKKVLEEVQVEVKREEERRSELQLQYTRDRCAWQLEKTELKCRIAQLETREGAGLTSGAVQSTAGPGSGVSQCSETPSLRREREEQRRLLADTHTTAMDLRCRLEHNEKDWLRERAELLERFDVERKEWESQLKDMQRKIEELYCEVRSKREGTGLGGGGQDYEHAVHRLSIRTSSTDSSFSDNSRSEPLSSSSHSEANRGAPLPGFGHNRNISRDGTDDHQSTCFQADSVCEFNVDNQFTQNDYSQPEVRHELRSGGTDGKEPEDAAVFNASFHGAPGCGGLQKHVSEGNEKSVHVGAKEDSLWSELNYGSDKKKNTTALNAALKEIARVSEELCSYQDEIRKKSVDKRNPSESVRLPAESELLFCHDKTRVEVDEAACDLRQIYDDLRALQRENWISLSPNSTCPANRSQCGSWRASNTDPDTQTKPGILSDIDTVAPPIPPRSSSRNLSTPSHPDTELHIPESPKMTVRTCHSPCVLVDKKCSSPSIVRKFEAMLQENEGKVFIDGMAASCSVPTNSNCNTGCCHNRWSCDTSKFSSSKLSAYGTVQKSFSEVNIRSAGKGLHTDYNLGVGNLKSIELQMPLVVKELPVDSPLLSSEVAPASPNLQGSRRNVMLEQKTAEFNRTLFQAEMGRGVEEQECFTVTDASSVGCQPVLSASDGLYLRETTFQPLYSDVTVSIMGVHPEVTLSLSNFDSTIQNPEVQPRGLRYGPDGQEVIMKQETPFELSAEQPQVSLWETTSATSQSSAHHSEVKHIVQIANSPSRKVQHRAVTEDLFSEPVLPVSTEPGQNAEGSSSKNENPHGAKQQHCRMGVSLQQPSAENKQRQMTQPGHQTQPRHVSVLPSQSDSSRPGPRMMNDHPWKPLTLAAYPRPEGSRSNYGALEKILKNYESAARAQQNQSQKNETAISPNLNFRQEEDITGLDVLDMNPPTSPPSLRHTQASHTCQAHSTQLSNHSAMGVKGIHLIMQDQEDYRWNT
ncbi:uncharacterized protein LOC113170723 isoform X2 [Anabas testudineus]|uniref:SOGA 1/2-like coiled-coil domain-containing protein n=1 Tax=Anabas testudineus TaxID=64144 RepID=A0A3Q1JVZ2_ANATE|nr:uncharacterized protein LOC113170723 isoform X2 [Anabas testudineus]